MIDYLTIDKDFNMLSLNDLLKARDLYHVHLMHKQNVVATAIGRYLIRHTEPWPKNYKDYAKENPKNRKTTVKPKRTLSNSEVRRAKATTFNELAARSINCVLSWQRLLLPDF